MWRLENHGTAIFFLPAMSVAGNISPDIAGDISPDSRWLAIVNDTGNVYLRDLSADPLGSSVHLPSRDRKIVQVRFDPQSRHLNGLSDHGEILSWRLRLDDLVDIACRTAGRNLTEKEWLRYLGLDEPYEPTCPGLVKKN